MCFLHAGIPSVTVGSTTALLLFWPSVPRVLCIYLFDKLAWLETLFTVCIERRDSILSFGYFGWIFILDSRARDRRRVRTGILTAFFVIIIIIIGFGVTKRAGRSSVGSPTRHSHGRGRSQRQPQGGRGQPTPDGGRPGIRGVSAASYM